MNTKSMSVAVLVGALLAAGIVSGCKTDKAPAGKEEEKHEAHHGGCLNAIETCAVGHAEVKLEGEVLKVWFVGGETETDKAVRVSDTQIVLAVTIDGGQGRSLTLEPRPIELAREKVGDCSYFEGKAAWLAGVKKFSAAGQVNLKGKGRPVRIEYPEGFDPDDQPASKAGEPAK
ncbi:MAG: hypothetical protein NTV86_00500 [Planctomycetota bacterium]|nr:hypothetical protein [Planctomycetota bacterium]